MSSSVSAKSRFDTIALLTTPAFACPGQRISSGIQGIAGAGCKSLMGSSRVGTHRAGSSGEVEVMTGQTELRPAGKGVLAAVGQETAPISAGQNTYLWAISIVAALGGLLFGYDWVVIGGAKPFYEKFFELRDASEQGWAMSCALVGCLLGPTSLSGCYGVHSAFSGDRIDPTRKISGPKA